MGTTILMVDDDPNLLSAMKRQLRARFAIETAQSGEDAIFHVSTKEPPAVVLCDMRMGGMNGIQTLRQIKERSPDSVLMMLTGNADMQTAINAINDGHIFRFLTKPCAPDVLEASLSAALEQHRLITAERELLEKTLSGSVKVLMDILAMSAPAAFGRATRIREWVRALAKEFNLPQRWQLDLAAMLAPLGMLAIPAEVSLKLRDKKPLTEVERGLIERSPEAARNIIAHIPRLGGVGQIVYLQNRGFDGSGFPADGPVGTDIPLDARILKILNDLAEVSEGGPPTEADFARLAASAKSYDPSLLQRIRQKLVVSAAKAPQASKLISSALLIPGMVLAAEIVGRDGRLLLPAQQIISEVHIEQLQNLAKLRLINDVISVLSGEG